MRIGVVEPMIMGKITETKGLSGAEDWGKDAAGRMDQQLLPRAQKDE